MKVFISWSGNTSLKVAVIFREWLPSVIQSIEPYVSSEDIDKGARWSTDIAKELENSNFGILCVTKENLEAPWLSFEAGALSKTMEKSFVTPFLFDIKRAEVKGPILQFQSTIFQKDDVKRMVQTLNKACGETGISDTMLDKAFDVWYPSLEESLNKLKTELPSPADEPTPDETNHSSEILEEILELSRDNQKLLRSPDETLYKDVTMIKGYLERISLRNDSLSERKMMSRKYNSMFFEELMHMGDRESSYAFLITLSLLKEDFPWIYDMGRDLLGILKSQKKPDTKTKAVRDFKEMVDFTFGHPLMRDMFVRSKDGMFFYKELPYMLMRSIDEMQERHI